MKTYRAIELALNGLIEAGRAAGAPPLLWEKDLKPNWVEFSGITGGKIKPEKAVEAGRKWAKALDLTEVDPIYEGSQLYAAGDGQIVVSVPVVTDPKVYAKRIKTGY